MYNAYDFADEFGWMGWEIVTAGYGQVTIRKEHIEGYPLGAFEFSFPVTPFPDGLYAAVNKFDPLQWAVNKRKYEGSGEEVRKLIRYAENALHEMSNLAYGISSDVRKRDQEERYKEMMTGAMFAFH